ncbi:hypothetical protein CRN80_02420 [Pseudomonas sp. FDAARGOS_380]|nr:hypothetical protein CRN80_02420 [Pseudomonas sp. FDAARGOS_380]
MLAKNINDNACLLNERGACEFFASKLAPTKCGQNAIEVCTYTVRGSPTYLPLLLSSNERV